MSILQNSKESKHSKRAQGADAWISFGRRNRIDFLSGLELDEEGNRSDGGWYQKRRLEKEGTWGVR